MNRERSWCDRHSYFVYYESIKRELTKTLIFECRCDTVVFKKFVYYESLRRELKTKPRRVFMVVYYESIKRELKTKLFVTPLKEHNK